MPQQTLGELFTSVINEIKPVAMTGADGTNTGAEGYAPAPTATDNTKYLKGDGTWADVDALPAVTSSDNDKSLEVKNGEWAVGSEKIDKHYMGDDWSEKVWSGGPQSWGGWGIWTDGEDVFLADSGYNYILNKATSTWSQINFTGLTITDTFYIWTDGENTYYSSYYSGNYIFDKSTLTWSSITFSGANQFYASDIWTDGNSTYLSDGAVQGVLDKSTSTWSAKIWTGLTNFKGRYIWTDGNNYYFSNGDQQYVLDKSTSTWSTKTWTGLTSFSASNIWTDGENIYYSENTNQYVLNKATSEWLEKTWTEVTPSYSNRIWSDGENYYYSEYTRHYIYNKPESKILLGQNGEFNPVNASGIILPTAPTSNGDYVLKVNIANGAATYSWIALSDLNT